MDKGPRGALFRPLGIYLSRSRFFLFLLLRSLLETLAASPGALLLSGLALSSLLSEPLSHLVGIHRFIWYLVEIDGGSHRQHLERRASLLTPLRDEGCYINRTPPPTSLQHLLLPLELCRLGGVEVLATSAPRGRGSATEMA